MNCFSYYTDTHITWSKAIKLGKASYGCTSLSSLCFIKHLASLAYQISGGGQNGNINNGIEKLNSHLEDCIIGSVCHNIHQEKLQMN